MALTSEQPAQPSSRQSQFNRWDLFQLVGITAAFLYLYNSVLRHLVHDWLNDPDYSHGFLIPILSLYFLSERWQKFLETRPQPSLWGLCLTVLGLASFLLASVGAERFVMRSSMVIVIAGLLFYHGGKERLQVLAFPIGFLFFMIPLPAILLNTVTFPLQLFAARLATLSLQLIDLPVYREGNVIFLPYATLEVVEACSGLRSLVSLLALSVVFAYMTQQQLWRRLTLTVAAVPIAIIANAFRIWGTGVLAYLYGVKAADGFYHTFAGWLVFVIAFLLLAAVGFVLSRFGRHTAQVKE
jgi:exosortase